eukprot:PhF_6_TR6942/c0_g1_i1/m.10184
MSPPAATHDAVSVEVEVNDASPKRIRLGSFYTPTHLTRLVHQVYQLSNEDVMYLHDLVTKKSERLFSTITYTGETWYLPRIEDVEDGESRWGVEYSMHRHELTVTILGRRLHLRVAGYILRFMLLVLAWFMCWSMMPHELSELHGFVFDPLLLIIASS